MHSDCGRYVLVFNGEIYNHLNLRRDLELVAEGRTWRGHSDTETLLASIAAWGLDEALCRASGMFALVLWDRKDRRMTLARDRVGEKPLYWGWPGPISFSDPNSRRFAPTQIFLPKSAALR